MEADHLHDYIRIQQIGFESLATVSEINRIVFQEERVINRFDRPDLVMLVAYANEEPAGFKIGYGLDRNEFYSAKGAVLEAYRRQGIASALLDSLLDEASRRGYRSYCFDTFPNLHIGMTVLALQRGFVVREVRYSETYKDLRVRFSMPLERPSPVDVPGWNRATASVGGRT